MELNSDDLLSIITTRTAAGVELNGSEHSYGFKCPICNKYTKIDKDISETFPNLVKINAKLIHTVGITVDLLEDYNE